MSEISIQEYLFQRIREKLPAEVSLADAVSELLYISNDSAYRRIRGETPLVLEEARILCDTYAISLDQLLKTDDTNAIAFSAVHINNGTYSFRHYLMDILDKLKYINSFSEKEVIYLSKDFVLFHNFLLQPLFAFRYFFWMKSIVQHPDFITSKFSLDILPVDIEQIGKDILNLYNLIPSTEVWCLSSLNTYIEQIEYYREAGYFKSDQDVEIVYASLRKVIEHLRLQAETGCKFLPGENYKSKKLNFQFYNNHLVLGDNAIMTILNGKKTLYLNYDVLNYISTQNERFCNTLYTKLQVFIRRATILSNVSEKQRNIFFNTLLKRIQLV